MICRRSFFSFRLTALVLVVLTGSCKNKSAPAESDAPLSLPTMGNVTLYADESFQPLLESTVQSFSRVYKNTEVDIRYVEERVALEKFLNFESPVVFVARRLTDRELAAHREKGFNTHQLKVATDALAFVVNSNNPDSLLTHDQLVNLLNGSLATWSGVSATNRSGTVALVFQKSSSSTATFVRDSILNLNALPPNSYALDTHPQVLEYVRNNTGAIGVIALNWISDTNDPGVLESLRGLRTVALSMPDASGLFYKPTKAHIRQGFYPFVRSVYVMNAEGRSGLGTGFASFLASDRGMTIIERFGLVPAKEPMRLIETRKSFD